MAKSSCADRNFPGGITNGAQWYDIQGIDGQNRSPISDQSNVLVRFKVHFKIISMVTKEYLQQLWKFLVVSIPLGIH